MRKHFLLLFLMALMPFVGWADNPKTKKAIINAAYTYKTYGEVDPPAPKFEFDASSEYKSEADRAAVAECLVLKRVTGEVGEDVGSYLYYIDFNEETYPASEYEIVILQNNSNLVIQKADLHVLAVENWKEFNTAKSGPFDYTIVSGLQWDDTKDDVKATITRPDDDVLDPVNGRLNPQGEPELVYDQIRYDDFKGEAKNYNILVDNEFYVVPATNVDNIKVNVYNNGKDAMVKPFVYRGTEYTPGAGQEEDNLVVTDGSYTLTPGVDYTLILDDSDPNYAYKNNTHVGTATVTINFEGSYSYDTDKTKDGKFKIKEKKYLTITAKSYTLAPGQADPEFKLKYAGWVNGEGNNKGPSTDPAPKGFKAPSGVTKVQIPGTTSYTLKVNDDAEADDYEIRYVDGLLSYGETSMRVTAVDKTKNYLDPDPKFTATVEVWDNDLDDYREPTAAEWAAIGGKDQPYYIFSRADGEDVGEYTITVDGPRVLPDGIIVNYESGLLTIDYKYVYLKGNDATKVYGEDDPPFDATVFGAKWDKETETWIIDETQEWTREQMDDEDIKNQVFYHVGVGSWNWWTQKWVHSENVTPENAPLAVEPGYHTNSPVTKNGEGNYYVYLANGKFTITPAPLKIQAEAKSKMYGEADPELTVKVTGLKFNDQIEPNVDYTISRKAGEDVGRYRITVKQKTTSEVLKNYTVTLKRNWFTINPMELKVVAKDQAIDYGQTINPYDVAIYKKVNNDWEPWIEYIYNPDDPESAEALAKEIAKYLMLTTTVTKVGATQNAYTLVPADNTNYDVKTDPDHFTNAWLTIAPLKTIPLDKDALAEITEVELKQVLEDHKGRTLNVTLPARRMQKDDWYSWVLPFEVKQRDFFKDGVWGYGSMEILDDKKTTDKSVTFSLVVAEPIKANTPFIAKIDNTIESDKMSAITFKNVTIDPNFDYINNVPTTGSEKQVQFIGVYEETLLGAGTRILARKTPTSPMEFWTGDGAYLAATKAYLQFPTEDAAREAKIFIEDQNGGTTEISGVKTEANSMNAEGWYNLNGVKMEGAPAQKGVYIKDGKKVVIK